MSAAAALLLLLAGGAEQRTDWRAVATIADRARLRGWRDAWIASLAAARRGDGAATIAGDPALFDPDDALDRPLPPAGAYRCRMVKFMATRLVTDDRRCLISPAGALLRLERPDGNQRFVGTIYPDATHRAIFLGAVSYADERKPVAYADAAGRDMAGIVERIGERRWRLVLPSPKFESTLDVLELVPAS